MKPISQINCDSLALDTMPAADPASRWRVRNLNGDHRKEYWIQCNTVKFQDTIHRGNTAQDGACHNHRSCYCNPFASSARRRWINWYASRIMHPGSVVVTVENTIIKKCAAMLSGFLPWSGDIWLSCKDCRTHTDNVHKAAGWQRRKSIHWSGLPATALLLLV